MKLCTALQFKKNEEGKLILQAKWQPIQFSGTYAIQLSGHETDWQDVDLAVDVLPVETASIIEEAAADPVDEIPQTLKSEEEKQEAAKEKKTKK